jgi:hypothetical protein
MTSAVHSWKQAGRAFVWRYPPHKKKHRGWHFTCDDAACDCLTNLIEAMRAEAEPSRRTISLSPATSDVWAVPNFGEPLRESHQKMVFEYDPNFGGLLLSKHEGRLRLHFGDATASTLIEAITDLKAGGGDYALPSNDRNASPIWIWWMLRSKR